MSVISAKEFRERATRVIQIDGFEPGEKIEVRIKPASILNMMVSGKLPNSLMGTVNELFTGGVNDVDVFNADPDTLKDLMSLIDIVCKECLVEPKYEEIGDLLTDNQKSQIMAEAQGNVTAATPNV